METTLPSSVHCSCRCASCRPNFGGMNLLFVLAILSFLGLSFNALVGVSVGICYHHRFP